VQTRVNYQIESGCGAHSCMVENAPPTGTLGDTLGYSNEAGAGWQVLICASVRRDAFPQQYLT
jgi:hypothetical protein